MVKLDAMENPHRLSPQLQDELGQRLGALALNRYPADRLNDLRAALARHAHMPEGFDIMLGNGSDELISLLAQVVLDDYATDIKDWYIQHEWEPYASLHRLAAASTSVGADD